MAVGSVLRLKILLSLCCFAFAVCGVFRPAALAQQQSLVFQGTWTATVGSGGQDFRGSWGAQTSPQNPNALQGSWNLLNNAGEIALQGTWSARKSAGAWHGTWSARSAGDGPYSGTWDADLHSFPGKTLQEMLKRALEKQVAGSWRSSRYQGFWWLNGSAPKTGTEKPH